jgi:hypothetical protein
MRLRILSKAADAVSAGDVATRAVRQYQNWSLAPFAGRPHALRARPTPKAAPAARGRMLPWPPRPACQLGFAAHAVALTTAPPLPPPPACAAAVGTVYPATYMRGSREVFSPHEPNFPRFSAWLGQNSSFGKKKRLLGELHTRMLSSGALECDKWAGRRGGWGGAEA